MGAVSAPMATTGSAVVCPILPHRPSGWQLPMSSVSSAMIAPGREVYQTGLFLPIPLKPIRLPKDIFITASAIPFSTAQAAAIFPS